MARRRAPSVLRFNSRAAAGFPNAWRVELLPEGADPMDTRYNIIQWVHRATRGWSYGAGVTDPRTGEIIKGQVTLGSLRVRQDWLIAEGLLAPYEEGKPPNQQLEAIALARLRQLAAHEVGHTLGLAHNFAASVRDRASVMDYPHPLVTLTPNGVLDLSKLPQITDGNTAFQALAADSAVVAISTVIPAPRSRSTTGCPTSVPSAARAVPGGNVATTPATTAG